MTHLQQWRCGELALTDTRAPHTAISGITALFTAPSGKTITREAFWDGGDTFRIRYALTEPGTWHCEVTGAQAPHSEDIECVPYDGDLPLYRHGFIKVGPRGRHLCHADGTPFFWLGDTHWQFAIKEKWAKSNDARFKSQFRAIVDKRAAQNFTVYQCNFHCEVTGTEDGTDCYFAKTDGAGGAETTWAPKPGFFQTDLDQKMAYLADNGFCIAAGFSWFFSAFHPDAKSYYTAAARYLIARYGAYPMVWTLAGEVGGYNAALRRPSIDFWRGIAETVAQYDSYNHLQTAHYTNERPFPSYYQDEDWFDFTLNQAGHGDYPIDCRPFRAHRAAHPAKPFVESESMYEHVLTLEPNGRRRATPAMLRRVAYLAMQNGACGYTYGAQGMWHLQWDEPKPDAPSLGFGSFDPWYTAIDFPGADEMTVMRNFYEKHGWHTLTPLAPGQLATNKQGGLVLTAEEDDLQALFMPSVTANEDMTTVVAYYSETNRFQVGFKTLTSPRYKAFWVDPATGAETLIDGNIRPENGTWFAPLKPTEGDALLVLRAAP